MFPSWVEMEGGSLKKGIVVIPDHGKEDIKMGTLNSIMKQAGLK